jgi:hypothetical protein
MTIQAINYIPSNLQGDALYVEMADNIQFILGKGEIELATTYANAIAKTSIDITGAGSGIHTIRNSLSNQTDTFTADASTDVLTLASFLDLEEGATVRVSNSGGALPTGLSVDTDYYVVVTPALARYVDIKNKYRDYLSLDNEIVRKIISEQGYDYISAILELMVLSNVESKVFLGYLGIVHFLKGNRRGLELVFGLLNLDYTLTEWWEKTPQGTVDTFDLTVNIDMSQYTFDDVDTYDTGIQAFVAQYVYPIFDTYAIKATLKVQSPYYTGASANFGEEIIVNPPIVGEVSTSDPAPYVAPFLITSDTITVNPP